MNYYYKTEHGILKAKHQLSEEELGEWKPITEEEYLSLKEAHKPQKRKKEQVEETPIEEGTSNG